MKQQIMGIQNLSRRRKEEKRQELPNKEGDVHSGQENELQNLRKKISVNKIKKGTTGAKKQTGRTVRMCKIHSSYNFIRREAKLQINGR
jgi:hypothetical protein